jgi:DNA (cytosine-5)-methyltransferase 1
VARVERPWVTTGPASRSSAWTSSRSRTIRSSSSGDALEALDRLSWGLALVDTVCVSIEDFDAIHASPPCQRWSRKTRDKEKHPDLITPLRPLLEATGLPYVIENVPGAPLKDPIQLCGSSFGLPLRRHRLFEANWPIWPLSCLHEKLPKKYRVYDHGKWYLSAFVPVYGMGGGKAKEHWAEAMGIDWMTHDEMREAIPPAYTRYIATGS